MDRQVRIEKGHKTLGTGKFENIDNLCIYIYILLLLLLIENKLIIYVLGNLHYKIFLVFRCTLCDKLKRLMI